MHRPVNAEAAETLRPQKDINTILCQKLETKVRFPAASALNANCRVTGMKISVFNVLLYAQAWSITLHTLVTFALHPVQALLRLFSHIGFRK